MRRYLAWSVGAMLFFASGVVATTIGVDPYRFFGSPEIRGLNEVKPRIYQHAAVAKQQQLRRSEPRTLFLGNSRIEIGFDPESRELPSAMTPAFNAALAGAGLGAATPFLFQAAQSKNLKTAIIGFDFQDSLESSTLPANLETEPPQLAPVPFGLAWWRDAAKLTLTLGAVTDSIATVFGQDRETGVTMLTNGFNPLNDYKLHARRIGYHELFARKNRSYGGDYAKRPRPDLSDVGRLSSFRALRSLLRIAARFGIDVVVLIHPYHADYLEMLHRLGLWQSFEEWKRAVVRLVEDERSKSHVSVRLVDFSGYHAFAVERVPPRGDVRTEMQWYWEPGHYKSALGDRMLARLYGQENRFGVELDELTVESHLANIRAARERYLSALYAGEVTSDFRQANVR